MALFKKTELTAPTATVPDRGATQVLGNVPYAFANRKAAPTPPLAEASTGGGGSWGPVAPPVAPVITPPVKPLGSGIVSSTTARTSLASDGNKLDQITAPGNDPYVEYLQGKDIRREVNYEPSGGSAEEKTVAAQSFKRQRQAEQDYNDYAAGLATLGIQSGLSRYAPELQADRMFNAQQAERMKIQDIQDTEELAIAKAKEARLNKDSVKLKEHLAEIKAARAEKRQAMQDQLNKRTQDITVAKSVAPYLADALKGLDPKDQEAKLIEVARENNVSPSTLVAALNVEADTARKFELQMRRQEQLINKAMGGAVDNTILTPSVLNTLKKQNAILDLQYGVTKGEALELTRMAEKIKMGVSEASKNPDLIDDEGKFTAEYINNALDNLPEGISREGFLDSVKDKLYLGKYKFAKEYGISENEYNNLKGE